MISGRVNCLFVPSNDSHVEWMIPIAQLLRDVSFMVIPSRREGAPESLSSQGYSYYEYRPGLLEEIRPAKIVLGNDWSPEELLILVEAKIAKIPSICIQEGAIFFPDKIKRLLNADYLFALGKKTFEYFPHPHGIITGNPKFDKYYRFPLPDLPNIMVNLNFTYGVEAQYRDIWLNDVLSVLQDTGVEYFISAHPRQNNINNIKADFPVILSNAFTTAQQIMRSTLLISRFSTLIYEVVAAGRKVIYYNPHNERFLTFQGGYKGVVYEAKSKNELRETLEYILEHPQIDEAVWRDYMIYHLGTADRDSAKRCAVALENIHGDGLLDNLEDLIKRTHEIMVDTLEANKWLKGQYHTLSDEVKRLESIVADMSDRSLKGFFRRLSSRVYAFWRKN
jgi:hypothetical protein